MRDVLRLTNKPKMSNEDFFKFFEQSDSVASDYVKLQDGDKKHLRIVSNPIQGFELFVEGKPVRWRVNDKRPEHAISDEKPKRFAAFTVVQYDHDKSEAHVKVWSFSQKVVHSQMDMLFRGKAHWIDFELVVTRRGAALKTTYDVTGIKSPAEPSVEQFARNNEQYVLLDNLFASESPFIKELPVLSIAKQEDKRDDLPF